MTKIAVVTGSNKGIGLATVQRLCKEFDGDVFLTGRDEERVRAAVDELNKEGLEPKSHLLDITSLESIQKFKKFIQDNYGGLDVLINNAGFAYGMGPDVPPFEVQVAHTLPINFWGTLNVCKELFPLLRPHARVVNVSSQVTTRFALPQLSEEIKTRVFNTKTIEGVEEFVKEFEHY